MFVLQDVDLTDAEKTYSVDLRPFMNPSPYTVLHVSIIVKIIEIYESFGSFLVLFVAQNVQTLPCVGNPSSSHCKRHERSRRNGDAKGFGTLSSVETSGPDGSGRIVDIERNLNQK